MSFDRLYDTVALEKIAAEQFDKPLVVSEIIVSRQPVGRLLRVTVFKTDKNQLFAYFEGETKVILGDIKKIMSYMGLSADKYLPPAGKPDYFVDIATEHFRQVFPGRRPQSEQELSYYQTLAPYNPALVQIKKIKNGLIRVYDADVKSGWRNYKRYNYNKIDEIKQL